MMSLDKDSEDGIKNSPKKIGLESFFQIDWIDLADRNWDLIYTLCLDFIGLAVFMAMLGIKKYY
jgi:hypothetical protein